MSSNELHTTKDVLAVILAGGAGQRLYPLTADDAKPAVPFGGIYRIIDFTLSNCVNSLLRKALVLVQYKSLSLTRHIRSAWDTMRPEWGEFIEVLPAQQRVNENWYLGTADAIYQNLYSINAIRPRQVLILSGDHIYKMDYQRMIAFHRSVGAELTISTIEVPIEEAVRYGVVQKDAGNRIVGFEEKPSAPRAIPDRPGRALISMGIYLFNRDVLTQVCVEDAQNTSGSHDFGKDILPRMLSKYRVYAYVFQDENRKQAQYWRDIGTIDSYWETNMDLIAVDPLFNLYDRAWPVYTYAPVAPPAKFVFGNQGSRYGVAIDSIVSPGCIVSGGEVRRSILSTGARVNSYCHMEDSILLPGASLGRYARVRRAIIGSNIAIPEHAMIGYDQESDRSNYQVTDKGIVVVDKQEFRLSEPTPRITAIFSA